MEPNSSESARHKIWQNLFKPPFTEWRLFFSLGCVSGAQIGLLPSDRVFGVKHALVYPLAV